MKRVGQILWLLKSVIGTALPGNAAAKDEDNAGKADAIRDTRPPTLWSSWWNRQERLDKIPQRIWKQGGGHSGSRYLAQQDQV